MAHLADKSKLSAVNYTLKVQNVKIDMHDDQVDACTSVMRMDLW